jgi:imidazolonepropionase-like amidohydrolase
MVRAHLYAVLVLFGACCVTANGKVVDDGLLITNVTLISPERSKPLPNATVVIRGDRIAKIGTDLSPGPEAKTIDGQGRFAFRA